MVVLDVKELKEPFTVLRPEEFLENNRCFSFGSLCSCFYFFLSRTVPEYIDRSDDVAWMLGCSLILLTIQVQVFLASRSREPTMCGAELFHDRRSGAFQLLEYQIF